MTAKTIMTLKATSGGIVRQVQLSLLAGSGVVIHNSMTSLYKANNLVIDSDYESAGDGTLTISAYATLNTNDSSVNIRTWDLDLVGSIDAGLGAMTLLPSKVGETIGLGGSTETGQLWITDAELSRMTSHGGLSVGSSVMGKIEIDGITISGSDTFGKLRLESLELAVFKTTDSIFNKGITVLVGSGIIFSATVTTSASPVLLSAGTGTVTIKSGVALSTSSQLLTIIADDFMNSAGEGSVSSGLSSLEIQPFSPGCTIGMGSGIVPGTTQMMLDNNELSQMFSTGINIGGLRAGNQVVSNVVETATSNILGMMTLESRFNGASIKFVGASSTFAGLTVQSDNGIDVGASITATSSIMYLDGDIDTSVDSNNKIIFADQKVVRAKTFLTLQATTGSMESSGMITLIAGSGVIIWSDITGSLTGKPFVLNADFDSQGDGTLTIATSKKVISNDSLCTITAWDIDILGSLSTGSGGLRIHSSVDGQTSLLGDLPTFVVSLINRN